ncbi:hypothetical protein EYZ11_004503 [Aspergillus tanneri]|uniref:Uncharacterized protein n=1 Tax=Aspergillus tanneri TaxID=1220188 RepID=A0A4V3UPQ0_9EURO|nr:hypothetical protein EYZ11_004503 [Aspergillus tanneri]
MTLMSSRLYGPGETSPRFGGRKRLWDLSVKILDLLEERFVWVLGTRNKGEYAPALVIKVWKASREDIDILHISAAFSFSSEFAMSVQN